MFIVALNAQNFGGHSDWRLPTIKELTTIVDSSIPFPGPIINTDYFPNTVLSLYSYYWSSTTYAGYPSYAWFVCFCSLYSGVVWSLPKSYDDVDGGGYVRAVRSAQCVSFDNFIDNGDGTVTNTDTGLMWQKATAPGTYTWEQALSYCENLPLAGYNDWRLPNRNELQSIVDYSRYNPSIDPIFNTESSYYWSYWSSTTHYDLDLAWHVYFGGGDVFLSFKSGYGDVRAVRGPDKNVIIVIPGVPGSSLCFAGRELWPGGIDFNPNDLLMLQYKCDGCNNGEICCPMTEDIEPKQILAISYGSKVGGFLKTLIIKGKPPALPGDSQSLTFSGVLYSPSPSPAKQGRLSGTEKLNNSV